MSPRPILGSARRWCAVNTTSTAQRGRLGRGPQSMGGGTNWTLDPAEQIRHNACRLVTCAKIRARSGGPFLLDEFETAFTMDPNKTSIERAFHLAGTGRFATVSDVKSAL